MSKYFINLIKEKCFQYTTILFLFYIAPLLINNNYYYVDDIVRLIYGNHPWTRDGRVIGDLLYAPFSFSFSQETNAYPLPLLIGLFFLIIAIALLYKRFGQEKPWLFSLCIFPLLANPFFISNLHFRYDSAFMVLSLGFSILPYAIEQGSLNRRFLLGVIFVICAFSSYQASANVFIGMIGIEMYYNLLIVQNSKKTVYSMLLRAFQLLLGFAIYSKFIIPLFKNNDYFKSYNKIISLSGNFLEKLFHNYLNSFHILRASGLKEANFVFIILVAAFLIMTAFLFLKHWKEKQTKLSEIFLVTFLLILSMMISIVAIPGIIIFGEHPIFISRVYLGFGIFMVYLLLPSCWIISRHSSFLLIVPSICAFFLFNLFYTANNAINEDYKYQNNISLLIIQDINRLNLNNKKIFITGTLPPVLATRNACKTFPIIKFFLDSSNLTHVTKRNGMDEVNIWEGQNVAEMKEFVPLLSTHYYQFYTFKDTVIVKLL